MKRLIPLCLVFIGFALWWWIREGENNRPQFSGTIEAKDVSVASKIGGRTVSVEVEEGDVVKQGDILVQLDRESIEARLRETESELRRARERQRELENGSRPQEIEHANALLEAARQQWQLLKNGPREEDIRAARANTEAARAEVQLASITEKRQKELFASKNTTAENLDRAQKELSVANSRLRAAEAELEQLLAGFRQEDIQASYAQVLAASAALALTMEGPRQEQIAQAQADTARLASVLDRVRIDLQETRITAPSDGVVETSTLEPGDLLAPNQSAMTLILDKPLTVRIFVPESRLGDASIGREIELSVASFPDKRFQGRIVQTNRRAEFTPRNVQTPETRDDLVFGVKIEIDDPGHQLRPGMVADVFLPLVKQ